MARYALVEELRGVGRVFQQGEFLAEVDYYIAVSREVRAPDQPGEPQQHISGYVVLVPSAPVELPDSPAELTLHLPDGRRLEFRITAPDGSIVAIREGLHRS